MKKYKKYKMPRIVPYRSAWQKAEDAAVVAMAKQMREEIDNMILSEIEVMAMGDEPLRKNIKGMRSV